MQCDILGGGTGIGFKVANVAAGCHCVASVGNYDVIIQCD